MDGVMWIVRCGWCSVDGGCGWCDVDGVVWMV